MKPAWADAAHTLTRQATDREVIMQTCVFPEQFFRDAFMSYSSAYLLGTVDEHITIIGGEDTSIPVLAEDEKAELLGEPLDLALDNSDTNSCNQSLDVSLS
jgi:hypothetical protein